MPDPNYPTRCHPDRKSEATRRLKTSSRPKERNDTPPQNVIPTEGAKRRSGGIYGAALGSALLTPVGRRDSRSARNHDPTRTSHFLSHRKPAAPDLGVPLPPTPDHRDLVEDRYLRRDSIPESAGYERSLSTVPRSAVAVRRKFRIPNSEFRILRAIARHSACCKAKRRQSHRSHHRRNPRWRRSPPRHS